MEAKQRIIESIYKAADVVILSDRAEVIREIRIRKKQSEWEITLTTETKHPLKKSPEHSRKFYKNVNLNGSDKVRQSSLLS